MFMKRMKGYFVLLSAGFLLLFLLLGPVGLSQTYSLESSAIKFEIKNAGLTVDGVFNAPEIELSIIDDDLSTMKLSGTVQAASINTGIGLRDKHLRDEKWFNVEKFPVIRMELIHLEKLEMQKYKGDFRLSLKGTTREVPVAIEVDRFNSKLKLTGTFKIDRRDYKVGSNSLLLSDEVNITVIAVFNTEK